MAKSFYLQVDTHAL